MPAKVDSNIHARTGIAGLDDILGGGFARNRLHLVDGDPGSGKTTLAFQFLLEGARAGEKCLFLSLSETKPELLSVAESHRWSVKGVDIVEILAGEKELDPDNALTMYHPSEVELSETIKSVLDAVERVEPSRVVFDSLSELRLLAQNSLTYRRQIMALKQFFLGRKCTALLLDDRTVGGQDIQLQSIAHGVLSLEQLAPEYGAERRRLRVLKLRGARYRGGFHDFKIRTGGLEVYPRLIAAEHSIPFEDSQIMSGVGALDSLLGGGVDRGTSTLFMGPAGSGKSTIAFQYAVAAANRNEHATVFAFDESVATLKLRTKAMGIEWREGRGKGELHVQQIDPAEVSPGEFSGMVREAVELDGSSIIVIDSLNGYINAMPEERFLTIQLHELLTYLGRCGVTTLMVVAQHGMVGENMRSPVDTSYLADSVVMLRYFEFDGQVHKAISVLKKRSSLHESSIRELAFSAKGISISEPLRNFSGILSGVPRVTPEHHERLGDAA